MKDFIIVGHGLAANVLMHTFRQHAISFTTIGHNSLSSCSRVAAGIWNPIVFKRSTKSWLADELIPTLNTFYSACETAMGKKLITQRPIIKPFIEEQEKQLWLKKSKSEVAGFTDECIHSDNPPELAHCKISNGYGIVKQSGNLNVADFIDYSETYFKEDFKNEVFDYARLNLFEDKVSYDDIEARHIIFCEGYRVKDNPYFKWIPLKPAKGETLHISTKELRLNKQVFNKNGFLMGVGDSVYKVGATYEWQDLTENPSEKGLLELKEKIQEMTDCDYTVISHEAGIRPSSLDRRPIIGSHPKHRQLFVFNGLGTKGVMLAPYFAKNFVNFYLQKNTLHPDVNLERFYHFYEA